MKIIMLGPPGAGKGTQSKVLAKEIRVAHISTGDILRGNVAQGTDLGKEAKGFMERGELVPDTLVTRMLVRRFDEPDIKAGFILDGYPRNLNQAKTLEDILKNKKIEIDLVFDLNCREEVIIQRLTGRRVCKKCGANFHVKNMPSKVEGKCDGCGNELYQRSDDNEQTVRTRLGVYKKEVASLIDYYKKQGKLRSVIADDDPAAIVTRMMAVIKEYHDSHKE